MDDRFGDVMLSNLRTRGCNLAGVAACTSLETQVDRYDVYNIIVIAASKCQFNAVCHFRIRFLSCGWTGSKAWDMVQVYDNVPGAERQRIEKLEMLDEAELLTQLFQHYCISIAWTGNLFEDIEIT